MLSEGEGNIGNKSEGELTRTQRFDFVIRPEDRACPTSKIRILPLEGTQPLKWHYTCHFCKKQGSSVLSVVDKYANVLLLMTFRCWADFPELLCAIIQQNMLKIPCEVSQTNTPAYWWCTSSCSSALHRCWLQTDGMQIVGFETSALSSLSQDRTQSDLSSPL